MRKSLKAALLAAASLLAATAAEATDLRFSHFLPPGHYFDNDAHAWAEALEEASGGSIKVQVFPASQLGAPADQYNIARDGIADIAWVNWGYMPGVFPIIELIDIPFSIEAERDVASRAFHNWYSEYAADEMPDVHFCLAHVGPPGSLHAAKPVAVPADVEGLKVRPSGGAMAQFIADLGGSAVQVPATEARQAIERGIADAITFPWGSLKFFGISDAVPHHLGRNFYNVGAGLVMNKAKYESLSEAEKKAVDELCSAEWGVKLGASWVEFENQGKEVLAKEGHDIHEPTDEEWALWKKAAEPSYARWAERVKEAGHDPAKVRAALDAAVEAEKAE